MTCLYPICLNAFAFLFARFYGFVCGGQGVVCASYLFKRAPRKNRKKLRIRLRQMLKNPVIG